MWMLRVVDAPAAIAARGFPPAVSVSVPLEIHDTARPANSGRWQLTVADGKGALTSDEAGAAVPPPAPPPAGPRGLAALYAGTPSPRCGCPAWPPAAADDDDALDAAFAATPYMLDDF